ncbi:type II CAAX prenyl endopeptidase Rce1 family protein [Nocardia sp. CNY236]|uniref:CPBP family glutamic-type intramembrane protease n=1 Tax=Nocardia sp. CNY236 TaxID=1169152 RepID=UPI000412756C|nr:CPBP family glutamic-type intramembrane protease [Nocardia sp. CNY236]
MSDARATRAVAAMVLPLAWNNVILPRFELGVRGRTVAHAGFATAYGFALRGQPQWGSRRALRCGLLAASAVVAGYGAALAVPWVRRHANALPDRRPAVSVLEWVAVHIPIGTVYSEELVFRGTLNPLLDEVFGSRAGALLGAAAFGLWHIAPANTASDSVPVTVMVTTVGGLVLGALRRTAAGASAPALLHLALNAGGATTPLLARCLERRRGEQRRGEQRRGEQCRRPH